MKAPARREVADRFAQMAVDQAEKLPRDPMPEDLLEMQNELEYVFYRELAEVRP